MSFHAGQSFTFGETPSATKWNYLWENDYALADGTGISDNAIDSRHYVDGSIDPEHHANRTRYQVMQMSADGSGGVTNTNIEGPEASMSGTPTAYLRAWGIVPADWKAGTDINIVVIVTATNTNTSKSTKYYLGARGDGDAYSPWNIASGITTQSISITANVLKKHTLTDVLPNASISAGDMVAMAWQISAAITGTVYVKAVYMEYTSNS